VMSAFAQRSVVFAALLLTSNAAALRPRALASTPPTDQRGCQLQISQSGTASIDVEPDQLVIRVSIKGPVASEAGEAAHKMKAVVDEVAGAKYTQTFHQDSSWDPHLRKTVKGDWAATGTVTLPIEAGKWGAADGGGSAAVSALINKLLALTSASSAPTPAQQQRSWYGGDAGYRRRRLQADGKDEEEGKGKEEEGKGDDKDNKSDASEEQNRYGYGGGGQQSDGSYYSEPTPSYAAPVQQEQHGDAGVKVSIESMHFAVSDKVTKSTQQQALSLAVADAISRIGEAAAPFRPAGSSYGENKGEEGEKGEASEGIGAQSLSEVRVTNGSGGSYQPLARSGMVGGAVPMAFDQELSADSGVVGAADLTYAVPQAQPVSQTVSVSACVNF